MESTVKHLTMQELEAALDHLREAPKDEGVLQLIVCRPDVDQRTILTEAELDPLKGLIGDNWIVRAKFKDTGRIAASRDADQHHELARHRTRGPGQGTLAPRGRSALHRHGFEQRKSACRRAHTSRLSSARSESPATHGCHKFVARFGAEAMKFVNSAVGRELCLRGINAKVVQAGVVKVGQVAKKI
jgi:hypothetical protein